MGLLCVAIALTVPLIATRQLEAAPGRSNGAATPADVLDITSVTPWVDADGDFQVRFGPTSSIPADAQLTYTIHQSLVPTKSEDLRDQVNGVIDGASAGKVLQAPETRPLSDFGDPATGAVLTIPIRSRSSEDRSRVLLPNPGIHPVELVLTSSNGPELWSQVVFLNRLPTPSTSTQEPVRVTLLMPIESPPTLGVDGTASFSIDERSALERAGSLLRAVPGAPLSLGLRPNTLDGLTRVDEPWSDSVVSSITAAVNPAPTSGSTTVTPEPTGLIALPYVAVDAGGLAAAGAGGEIGRQVDLGAQVTQGATGATASTTTWVLDDSLTPDALDVLASRGVDTVIVPGSALTLPNGIAAQRAMTGAVRLDAGQGMRAIAYDDDLSLTLSNATVDPGVRAHEVVSVMMASWFEAEASKDDEAPASVILVPPAIDSQVITALEPSLDGRGPLIADASLPVLPDSVADEPTAVLTRREPPDERAAVAATAETRRQIAAYRSMAPAAESELELWDRLDAETLAAALAPAQRLELHDTVRRQIAADVAQIEPPRARRVVLTSRTTTIPLRLRNDLPYDMRVTLRARSPRLDINSGRAQNIVLAPGENRIDLPVVVQAPGESLLRIDIMSPDGGLEIASTTVPVRSTAISGAGAALSVISLLFLVLWWIHTHRRRRRHTARDAGTHPCNSGGRSTNDAPDPDSVTEGG